MKKIVLFLSVSLVFILAGGCIKEKETCQPKTIASEDAAMLNVAAATGHTFIKHSSGMYYNILTQGSGATPASNSTLSVKYTGKLSDGTVFETKTTPVNFSLSGVIIGWQITMPLIQKGGKIEMIIPSLYAFGCTGTGPIPPYAILYYEVELIDVL